jgi:hypothetical protein
LVINGSVLTLFKRSLSFLSLKGLVENLQGVSVSSLIAYHFIWWRIGVNCIPKQFLSSLSRDVRAVKALQDVGIQQSLLQDVGTRTPSSQSPLQDVDIQQSLLQDVGTRITQQSKPPTGRRHPTKPLTGRRHPSTHKSPY